MGRRIDSWLMDMHGVFVREKSAAPRAEASLARRGARGRYPGWVTDSIADLLDELESEPGG